MNRKIQKPLQIVKNKDHCFKMNLSRSSSEFGHDTNKICNVKVNVGGMKKLA
jgi:hypothetical protein